MRAAKSGGAIIIATATLVCSLFLFVPLPREADAQVSGGQQYVPLGYCQLTSLSASIGLASCPTIGIPAGATRAVITPEAQAVRWRDDGTAPSATVGMPLAVAATITYSGTLSKIRFIESTSGAKLNVSFYR